MAAENAAENAFDELALWVTRKIRESPERSLARSTLIKRLPAQRP